MNIHASSKISTQKILDCNHQNNLDSDYTEKIEEIYKNFQYDRNSQHYWSDPKLSLLYGTPLYEQCSETQKLALNHLYWALTYHKIVADSEIEATRYNLITAGSFIAKSNSYQGLADMLEHETNQECIHIKAFHKIASQVYKNTIEKRSEKAPKLSTNNFQPDDFQSPELTDLLAQLSQESSEKSELKSAFEDNIYVKQFKASKKDVCSPTNGFFNGLTGNFSQPVRQLFVTSWGSSPFMACSFYVSRYISNLFLKNFEYKISRYYTGLQRNNQFIPEPTSISHYHFLDEAFHTITSLKLGRDLHKELAKPTEYEKLFSNVLVYAIQSINLGALSGVLPNRLMPDAHVMPLIYKVLTSTLFDMSNDEALGWMEKCLCHQHDGFDANKTFHHQMVLDMRRFTDSLDYLWPVNREMQLVDIGGSIDRAVTKNAKAFSQFSVCMSS
jgi:hypothetical protein